MSVIDILIKIIIKSGLLIKRKMSRFIWPVKMKLYKQHCANSFGAFICDEILLFLYFFCNCSLVLIKIMKSLILFHIKDLFFNVISREGYSA